MLVKCGIIWIENINSRRFDGGWVNNCNFELFRLTLRFRHIPIWLICYTYICVLIIPDDRRQIDPLSLTMSQRISNVWHRCVRMKLNPKPESFKSFELNGCHQSHAIHTQITHELNTLRSEWNGKIARFYAYRRTQKVEDRKNNNKWKREREKKSVVEQTSKPFGFESSKICINWLKIHTASQPSELHRRHTTNYDDIAEMCQILREWKQKIAWWKNKTSENNKKKLCTNKVRQCSGYTAHNWKTPPEWTISDWGPWKAMNCEVWEKGWGGGRIG